MGKPGIASLYLFGAALLAIFGLVAWLVLTAQESDLTRLTKAAAGCGIDDPAFVRRGDTYFPMPAISPAEPTSACLERAAQSIGVRVGNEQTVMVN